MMLRRVLVLLAVLGMVVGTASTAVAGVLSNTESTLSIKLGGLQSINISGTYQNGATASLSDSGGAHALSDDAGIWQTAGLGVGTSLFTGVALISDLVASVTNDAAALTVSFSAPNSVAGNQASAASNLSGTICPSGCLGGTETISGNLLILVGGFPIPFAASVVGIGGTETLMTNATSGTIRATGGPFVTGKVRITNVTSNVVRLPNRSPAVTGLAFSLDPTSQEQVQTFTTLGGFITSNPAGNLKEVATVTIAGTNGLASASAGGMVTLVSPLRIDTGPLLVNNLPGKVTKMFVFVPEPGTMLLLASGAAGLVILGRRRSKK